jgi:hypothetical protein
VKRQHLLSVVIMLAALLMGFAAPPGHSFEDRFVRLPAALSWQEAARKAAERPSFTPRCPAFTPPWPQCRIG